MPDTTIKKISSGASPKGEMGQVYLDGPKRAISAGCSSFSICSSGCSLDVLRSKGSLEAEVSRFASS
jgi:hypothetical protein